MFYFCSESTEKNELVTKDMNVNEYDRLSKITLWHISK